ncbi:RNA-binding S4 domain-containing protein [Anaerosolibacter sp.]|uniref:RNA-binding S4 domain-containing protein n=1 Tax=Anaerosolibacter sp. TaxID=1872527 RepID=UPI002611717B|nr:RNA-binding S4 domain-containing protein [Anaerosolibacter sp.]MDF2548332.1 RNA-binding protein [Anaerosolibacter sp.]
MRIDKFLKNSRLIKRRTIAKEACDQGRIRVNGQVAKAGTEVKIGDRIILEFGTKSTTVEVTDISEHVTKESSKEMYKVIE